MKDPDPIPTTLGELLPRPEDKKEPVVRRISDTVVVEDGKFRTDKHNPPEIDYTLPMKVPPVDISYWEWYE
jgi:hypothetical protein